MQRVHSSQGRDPSCPIPSLSAMSDREHDPARLRPVLHAPVIRHAEEDYVSDKPANQYFPEHTPDGVTGSEAPSDRRQP